jgi:hypothetical protein
MEESQTGSEIWKVGDGSRFLRNGKGDGENRL